MVIGRVFFRGFLLGVEGLLGSLIGCPGAVFTLLEAVSLRKKLRKL